MDNILTQAAIEHAEQKRIRQGCSFYAYFFTREDFQRNRCRTGERLNPRRVTSHTERFTMVSAKDANLVVGLGQMRIDWHMHHQISRLRTQIMALPDHVAQVVIHVLVSIETDDFGGQAQLAGDSTRQLNINSFAGFGKRQEIVVDRNAQTPTLAEYLKITCPAGKDRHQRQTGQRPQQKSAFSLHEQSPARHESPTSLPDSTYLQTEACILAHLSQHLCECAA